MEKTKLNVAPLKRESLSDAVVRILLEAMLAGELRPGSRIVEADLAEKTGISRGPVREALRQLEGEGLLTSSPSRGTYVTRWNSVDVRDAFDLRATLERFAVVRTVKRITPEEVAMLRETVRQIAACADAGDVLGILHADLKFHEQLYWMSGHAMATRMLNQLQRQLYTLMSFHGGYITHRELLAGEHAAIVDAIEAGDEEKASDMLASHIQTAGEALEKQVSEWEKGNGR